MAGLEGTVKTPFGAVQKKTAILVGGGGVLILGIIWYRGKKHAATASAGANTGINPATGYAYGSAEDAQALANQSAYITPTAGGGGGGGGGSGNKGFTNNAEWTQATITGMVNSGVVQDATKLSEALGKYIAGQPAGEYRSLIEQAIAFSGYPPVAGANGYPPSINTSNPTPTTPPPATPPTTPRIPPPTTPPPTTPPPPSKPAVPASAVAPAMTNLYTWSQEQEGKYGLTYMVIDRCKETGAVRWGGPMGSNQYGAIPYFPNPTTVRLG